MGQFCDICGDIIIKHPVGLSMGYLPPAEPFPTYQEQEEYDREVQKYASVTKCLFDIEICHNCAVRMPMVLRLLRKKIRLFPRVKVRQEVKNGHPKRDSDQKERTV